MPLAFELYCRVVDNFGDAGVCWRLARQLAARDASVRLWIDRPDTLQAIVPGARPGGRHLGVLVEQWPDDGRAPPAGRVVLSAFGCELPAAVRRRLAEPSPPLWVNLEYLSAEPWVEGCHGLASRKPADGAVEHFFYPGFTPATGGLLREPGLAQARDALQQAGHARRWLEGRGLAPEAGERLISLFCYPDAPVRPLLEHLATGGRPTRVFIPAGVAVEPLTALLGRPLAVGDCLRTGALSLHRFALLSQDDYDRLLWCCDLNFVRGEDSWVRAHWAARPFVWQPYPQEAATRRAKLDAFLDRFASVAGPLDEAASLMRAWCDGAPTLAEAWARFEAALPRLAPAYRTWAAHLAAQDDLASRLLAFCRDRL